MLDPCRFLQKTVFAREQLLNPTFSVSKTNSEPFKIRSTFTDWTSSCKNQTWVCKSLRFTIDPSVNFHTAHRPSPASCTEKKMEKLLERRAVKKQTKWYICRHRTFGYSNNNKNSKFAKITFGHPPEDSRCLIIDMRPIFAEGSFCRFQIFAVRRTFEFFNLKHSDPELTSSISTGSMVFACSSASKSQVSTCSRQPSNSVIVSSMILFLRRLDFWLELDDLRDRISVDCKIN